MVQQFFEFIGNHPLLFGTLIFVVSWLVWDIVREQIYGSGSLLPHEATLLINHEDAVILDVREEKEYKQGHILNSLHVPLSLLSGKMNRLEKYRNRPIIASCMTGSRSSRVCTQLKKNGFQKVYNLKGGIYAWQNANLPLTRNTKN